MAAWQADFHVVLPGPVLPSDYAERLARVLPTGRHWDTSTERWGVEDDRFLAFVQGIGGHLRDADRDADVALTPEAFMDNLRGSRAARFVRDPQAYCEELRRNPLRTPEER
jgi:hypothetical protein